MKKLFRILCAAMLLVSFAACSEKEDQNDNPTGGDNYSALLMGTWQVDLLSVDGQDMTPEDMKISFYEGGNGLMSDRGVTENNDFTWVINGNTITVSPHHHQFVFTIDNLTATECSFHGNYIEFDGNDINGDIRFHMTKENGDNQ